MQQTKNQISSKKTRRTCNHGKMPAKAERKDEKKPTCRF